MKYYFNIVIFIIQYKIMSFKIFDSFQSSQLNDTGDLIDIKDYHNLSIAISTSKNIYIGFPPVLKTNILEDIDIISSGITINVNYILLSCVSGYALSKLNINTGIITFFNFFQSETDTNCPISIFQDTVYIVYPNNYDGVISPYILILDLINKEDTNGGPSTESFQMKFFPSFESTTKKYKISCDIISILNGDEFHLVCCFVKKETIDSQIHYNIYGFVEGNQFLILSSTIETEINVYKLNNYSLRCVITDKIQDIIIEKTGEEIQITKLSETNLPNNTFISYSNVFKFTGSNEGLKIEKNETFHYYYLKKSLTLKKIYGIYNEINDSIILYY